MQALYARCAGLDVHKKTLTACVLIWEAGKLHRQLRTFETTVRALLALRGWLQEQGVTHVALESTGVFWIPVYNLLEGSAELLLVNAKHVKHVPGRKTDVKDAEWLAELLRHGLLKASFVPPQAQRDLRDLTRNRAMLVGERAAVCNRIQKVLEGANVKLASVASDVVGASGRAMLEAMLEGTVAPEVLAQLAKGKLREKRAQLEAALEGRMRDHHRFLLTQHLTQLDFLAELVVHYDAQIAGQLQRMDAAAGSPPPESAPAEPAAAAAVAEPRGEGAGAGPAPAPRAVPRSQQPLPERPLGYAAAVQLLDPIPGVAERGAQAILAEIGTDMRRFVSSGHLAAWAGVAPGNHESAGKRRSGKTTEGNAALQKALMQAAHGAKITKGSYFGALYSRLAARRGKRRAIVAVAHALLVAIYHMLLYHEPYRELGRDYYDDRRKEGLVEHLVQRIERLGYRATVELKAVPTPA